MQYVVFGAGGYIGSYLFQQLQRDGFSVTGTSRNLQGAGNMLFYDILSSHSRDITAKICDSDKTAVICIAEPNIGKCYENYSQAYEINVTRTKQLIKELVEEGFRLIYFSTDNVFDGTGGIYTEESQTNAINKYGMMKAEMEHYLLAEEPRVCILRISKVVSTIRARQNIFTQWISQREMGSVRCIRGNRLSFVCMDDIYHACLIAAEKKLQGLYNVVGDKAYSRAELARKFFDRLQITDVDIQECDVSEFSLKDNRPLNLELSNFKFKNATGYQFMAMDAVIEKYIAHMNEDKQSK